MPQATAAISTAKKPMAAYGGFPPAARAGAMRGTFGTGRSLSFDAVMMKPGRLTFRRLRLC